MRNGRMEDSVKVIFMPLNLLSLDCFKRVSETARIGVFEIDPSVDQAEIQ